MSPAAAAPATVHGGIQWSSPVPYLYGGLALVLALIAAALVVLACTGDKRSDDEEKPSAAAGRCSCVADDGPRVVVIIAGDGCPTFLAKPAPVAAARPAATGAGQCSPAGDDQV